MDLQKAVKASIRYVPSALGFLVARRLASRPPRARVTDAEAEAMRSAAPLRLGVSGRLRAWSWGSGPAVGLVHGWGGRAAQMAPLASRLAEAGFRAIAFDVAGHGESPEPNARWASFLRDTADFATSAGPLRAFIGHSAGGLAMMASRRVHGLASERFVCVCSPSHPYPPIRGLEARLNPGARVLERYRSFLGRQFETDWPSLESGIAWQGAARELLLCYDEKDRFIDPADGDKIMHCAPDRSS